MISSLAVMAATSGEVKILKMIVYPRIIDYLYHILKERGYVKDFKYGDVIIYSLMCFLVPWSYMF